MERQKKCIIAASGKTQGMQLFLNERSDRLHQHESDLIWER